MTREEILGSEPSPPFVRELDLLRGAFALRAHAEGGVEFGILNPDKTYTTLLVTREDAEFTARTFLAFVQTLPARMEYAEAPPSPEERHEGPCPKCHGIKIDVAENEPTMRRCQQCDQVWKVKA